jgi:hypothetical protein
VNKHTLYKALKQNKEELNLARKSLNIQRIYELLIARDLLKDSLIELLEKRAE